MAGHSQYNNRKRRIEAQGQRLNKIYMKVKKMIIRALKEGSDSALDRVIKESKKVGISAEKIDTIIKVAKNEKDKSNYDDVTYEGVGPYGISVMITVSTNNRNRTAGEIRSIFTKFGCKLGVDGCIAFMFDKLGLVVYEKKDNINVANLLEFMSENIEVDIQDIDETESVIKLWCGAQDLFKMSELLYSEFGEYLEARIGWRSKENINIDNYDEAHVEKIYKFLDCLENNDDVVSLDLNANIM